MTLLDRTPPAPGDAGSTLATVCAVERLTPDRGVAALVGGTAMAVFLLGSGEVVAVDNIDPFSGASVLSRGIVGDVDGTPTVASPLYKQRFDLLTGRCIDDASVCIGVHEAAIVDGAVVVRVVT